MISRFFIDRPIFAAVLSIVITLAGAVSVFTLPLAQFPPITPPTVQVTCNYPGASAKDVAESIAAPIEQQVNGVDGMMYMSSQCTNDGTYNLTVTFQHGVDLNMAQVLVQTRVNLALQNLPDVIKQTGVTTLKRSPDILCGFALYSPNGKKSQLYLSNYALMQIRDELLRVPGVSDVFLFGQRDYSMRLWLDPQQLAARNLTAGDVVNALREQNNQVATGQIGQPPVNSGQPTQVTLSTLGRLTEVEQFENIILKATPDGRLLRLKDVGKAEIGAKNQDVNVRMDGRDTIFLAVFQLPDANGLNTFDLAVAKMEELKKNFPDGVDYTIGFDTTPYTRESIKEVFKTLGDAVILVAIVVLLFLQNWRSAIIPMVAVPVAIVGTFAAMAAIGFSINNLTLFGLVLAIGIVVDDAIVVVEAVEHHIENGLAPREATVRAMEQVSGPVIAVGLVLSAVFVPCAFISGITGQFFRQFALTIAVSTLISAFNSLTLSPALTALLLRPRDKGSAPPLPWLVFPVAGGLLGWFHLGGWLKEGLEALPWEGTSDLLSADWWVSPAAGAALGVIAGALVGGPLNHALRWFFRKFNAGFTHATHGYTRGVRHMLQGRAPLMRLAVAAVVGWLGYRQYLVRWLAALVGQLPECDPAETLAVLTDGHGFLPAWVAQGLWAAAAALAGWLASGLLFRLPGEIYARLRRRATAADGGAAPWLRLAVPGVVVVLLAYCGLVALTWRGHEETSKGFVPSQDMGYLMINVQLPDSASLERTQRVMNQATRIARETPGVKHVTAIAGQSFVLNAFASNFGSMFINLKEYRFRRTPDVSSEAVANTLRQRFAEEISEAQIAVFGPPPIRGVGRAGGFALMVEDRGDVGLRMLQEQTENLVRHGNETPGLVGLFSVFRANVPQVRIDADMAQCRQRGVLIKDFQDTLQVYVGSLYVNDFNLFGRTWQVNLQADAPFRTRLEDLSLLEVRNTRGRMVPLGSLAGLREVTGPLVVTRYNMYPAAMINGGAMPGVSSGDVLDIMKSLTDAELPANMNFEWTDMSYLELLAGSTAMIIFGFAVVMVFLVLAAQYESWSLPLAVILVVPMCLLSAIAGVAIAKMDINIFTRIGFVVLVGLASKNAILIVEFAKLQRQAGLSRAEATLEACKLRLRPIIMTSFAFVLGVVPLILSTGAGAEMRKTLGVAVFSGMLGVTLFGIFLTPVFFFTIDWLGETHLFRSPGMHRFGTWALRVVTLGVPEAVHYFGWLARRSGGPGIKKAGPGAKPGVVVYVREEVPGPAANGHGESAPRETVPGDGAAGAQGNGNGVNGSAVHPPVHEK